MSTQTLTTITPADAAKLLLTNVGNRKISKSAVKTYADDMRAGRWVYNGDPIRVSDEGVLLDGQHRLKACIEAGTPIEVMLVEGLPSTVGVTIDSGRKRSAADVLNIKSGGSLSATAICATARQVLNYTQGLSANIRQSTPAIMALLDAYPQIADLTVLARRCDGLTPTSSLALVLFIGTRARGMDARAQSFVDGVHDGAALAAGDARLACRNAFIKARIRGVGAKSLAPTWCISVIAACWNAYALGRTLTFPKAQTDAAGRYITPNIVGGPRAGLGVESLREVALSGRVKKAADGGLVLTTETSP